MTYERPHSVATFDLSILICSCFIMINIEQSFVHTIIQTIDKAGTKAHYYK